MYFRFSYILIKYSSLWLSDLVTCTVNTIIRMYSFYSQCPFRYLAVYVLDDLKKMQKLRHMHYGVQHFEYSHWYLLFVKRQ